MDCLINKESTHFSNNDDICFDFSSKNAKSSSNNESLKFNSQDMSFHQVANEASNMISKQNPGIEKISE